MAKITEDIVYGLKDQEKVNKIVDLFQVERPTWDSLNLEMYDEVIEDYNNMLYGHAFKQFYRCDSKVLKPLTQQLLSDKNSPYITQISKVVKEDGIIPEKVSVLIKYSDKKKVLKEVIATKILNYFGVKTPYNFYVQDNQKPEGAYLGSVDLISEDEKFYTMADLEISFYENIDWMFENIDTLNIQNNKRTYAPMFSQTKKAKVYENKEKIKQDLVMSYLVRGVLLNDMDFTSANCGFLLNSKTDEIKIVDFDFELALSDIRDYPDDLYRTNISYIMKNYPKIYRDFFNKVIEIISVIDEVEILGDDLKHQKIIDEIKKRLHNVVSYHNDELDLIR